MPFDLIIADGTVVSASPTPRRSNFNRYLNRLRIARARELLSNSEAPVTSIRHEVGCNNVANLNRHFKEYQAMTPREYRKQVKVRWTDVELSRPE